MAEREIPLVGGRVTQGVVRIGDTVRRPTKPGAVDQSALLDHLSARDFSGAPRALGIDEQGRAILSYLAGDVPRDLGHFDDSQLVAAATLLRRFHDATTTFPAVRSAGAEIICHNDFGPPNAVFRDDLPWAMIDFDTATPGSRLWDLGYSAFSWLDLGEDTYTGAEQLRRLDLFTAAYDHPNCSTALVAVYAVSRQVRLASRARSLGDTAMMDWAVNAAAWTASNLLELLHPSGLADGAGPQATPS